MNIVPRSLCIYYRASLVEMVLKVARVQVVLMEMMVNLETVGQMDQV